MYSAFSLWFTLKQMHASSNGAKKSCWLFKFYSISGLKWYLKETFRIFKHAYEKRITLRNWLSKLELCNDYAHTSHSIFNGCATQVWFQTWGLNNCPVSTSQGDKTGDVCPSPHCLCFPKCLVETVFFFFKQT